MGERGGRGSWKVSLIAVQSVLKFALQIIEYYMTHIWFVDKRNHVYKLVLIKIKSSSELFETVRQAVLVEEYLF